MRGTTELKRMKAERNNPGARKRTEMFAGIARPQADVAILLIDINFDFGRRNHSPPRISALRRDK